MNKKKITALVMSAFIVTGLSTNIVVSANNENGLEYTAKYSSEPIVEVEVPKSEMTATATSAQPNAEADKAIDGNINTLWHTPHSGVDVLNDLQSVSLDLGEERKVTSVHVTPRQIGTNGKINGYRIYSGETIVAEGRWDSSSDVKVVTFDEPILTDNIKVEATSSYGYGINTFVSIAEITVYQASEEAAAKLVNEGNKVITAGEGGDITESLEAIKTLEEGTAIVRFTESGEGIQSLFSISNNTRAAEHFHVYINGGQVGYELRNASGMVSSEKATAQLNAGINTLAFRAEKDSGYSIYLNGKRILSVADEDAGFLSHLEGANSFSLGKTDRTGNEYPMTGKVDFIQVYDAPLTDAYLREVTGETIRGEYPVPEGTFKSDPINLFEPGDLGSPNFRIPAMYTTSSGTVLASIDVRQGGGHDAPNNIDVGIIRSEDNGVTWTDQQVILDYPGASSAIDTALMQDPETGRIFLMVTHFSENYGFNQSLTSSGYEEVPLLDEDGEPVLDEDGNPIVNKYLIVIHHEDEQEYTVREGGIIHDPEGNPTEYTVDEDQNLFKDGELNGHILTNEGDFKMIGTTFITMIHSDDDGRTWSKPVDINKQAKEDWMRFFGTGPGRGHVIKTGEYAGRLLFPIYVTNAIGFQSSACLYSDDNGETWHYGESATDGRITNTGEVASAETMTRDMGLEQLTECQVVEMPNGQIKMFMRNTTNRVKVATSFDGGVTWDNVIDTEEELIEPYCQLTVMNYSQQVDGKDAIIFANPAGGGRTGGTVRIGLINENGTHENGEPRYEFEWEYSQLIKEGVYAYSCLTELPDGNIGLFYEGTGNEEMSFTAMDTNYIKVDLLASVPASTIESIVSLDETESYRPGDVANLKVTFNEAVSLIGDKDLSIEVNDVEIPVRVEGVSGTEYKVTGTIPADMEDGGYAITLKSKEGLEVINAYGKIMDLSNDIVTTSNLIVSSDIAEETKVFGYGDLTLDGTEGIDITSDVIEDIKALEEGTIVMEFDNKGGNAFQALLSFGNNTEDRERLYMFINRNNQIGLEVQGSSGPLVLTANNLELKDGMNKVALKVESGVGYSIFVNGVKAATVADEDLKFIKGVEGLNSVNIGFSDRSTMGGTPFTGDFNFIDLYSDVKSDEELIELTGEEEVVIVDKTALQTVVDSVEDLNSSLYTEETWTAVADALTSANTVLGDEDATQEEVDNAKRVLETAIVGLLEAEGAYGNISLTVDNEINIGDTINLEIAINDMQESYEATAAEITLGYDDSVFDLGDITSVDTSKYIVQSGEAVDGVVKVLVASMGEPIVSTDNLINIELTARGVAEASPLVVSGAISDGDTEKEVTQKTSTVKVSDELHTFALEVAVEMAEEITEEELEDVVPAVLAEFNEALAEAKALLAKVEAGDFVTQSQIQASFDRLGLAMQMLEHKGDRTELLALVENINELVEAEYTTASWTNLQTVLNSDLVQDVLEDENTLQAEIEEAYTALFEAFSGLVNRAEEVDRERLEGLIEDVELIEVDKDKYLPSTWANLEEALEIANRVFDNIDSTQEEVLEAYEELLRAYLELRLAPDKSLLEDLLNKAEELKAEDYTVESFNSFGVAFKNARIVFENPEASKAEVDKAEENLQKAMRNLVASANTEGDKETGNNSTSGNNNTNGNNNTGEGDKKPTENDKLPQTGGTSAVTVGLFGTVLATLGAVISRKKKS